MDDDAELSMAALVRDGVVRVRRQPLALARVIRRSWWRRLLAWRPWAPIFCEASVVWPCQRCGYFTLDTHRPQRGEFLFTICEGVSAHNPARCWTTTIRME